MLILGIVILLLLDSLWVTVNRSMYNKLVKNVQKSELVVKIPAAIIAYTAMILGLIFIVIPLAKQDKSKNNLFKALRYGGLFGLVVYAIYNATNYAIFRNYSPTVALMDTIWGTTVYTIATYVALV